MNIQEFCFGIINNGPIIYPPRYVSSTLIKRHCPMQEFIDFLILPTGKFTQVISPNLQKTQNCYIKYSLATYSHIFSSVLYGRVKPYLYQQFNIPHPTSAKCLSYNVFGSEYFTPLYQRQYINVQARWKLHSGGQSEHINHNLF